MTESIPTTESIKALVAWASVQDLPDDERTAPKMAEARVRFDRWLESVERIAAAKALTDAIDQVNAKAKAYADSAIGLRTEKEWADSNRYSNYAAGLDMAANEIHKAAEAYRREGKE